VGKPRKKRLQGTDSKGWHFSKKAKKERKRLQLTANKRLRPGLASISVIQLVTELRVRAKS
jgi:hypothetical protein